jgi:hypothetical protein
LFGWVFPTPLGPQSIARLRINDVYRRATIVQKQLVARHVGLPQGGMESSFPLPIVGTKARIAERLVDSEGIFFPQQLTRDAFALPLLMTLGEVWSRSGADGGFPCAP